MFQALLDPVAGNLGLSALVACIPLLTFFVMLLGAKAKAHVSAVVALVAALVVGLSFAITQWWCSNYFAYELTDVIASLVGLCALVIFMRVWKPKGVDAVRARFDLPPTSEAEESDLTINRTVMALVPYVIVVVVFAICKLGIPDILAQTDIKIPWPVISGGLCSALQPRTRAPRSTSISSRRRAPCCWLLASSPLPYIRRIPNRVATR